MIFSRSTASIDIGTQSVKVAHLQDGRSGVRVIRFAEQPLPARYRWELGGDRQPLVEAIRLALAKAGIRTRRALLSLPRRQVTARIEPFPPVADQAELRRVVEYDLGDHIPFPLEQMVVDIQNLGPSWDQPDLHDVLTIAAQHDLVQEYLALATETGLRPVAITIDSLALHDLTLAAGEERPGLTLTAAVGSRATIINISERKRLRLLRSVSIGGEYLTQALRDDFGIEQEEATQLKLTEGFRVLERKPAPERTAAWLTNLRGEMSRSVLSLRPSVLSRILLVGSGAIVPGLKEAIKEEFGIEPMQLSIAELFPETRLLGQDDGALNGCLLAIGQGLRAIGRSASTISLLPRELAKRRRARWLRLAGVASAVALIAAMIVAYVSANRGIDRAKTRVAVLEKHVKLAGKQIVQADELKRKLDLMQKQLNALEPVRARRYAALELLNTIAFYSPQDVVITRFTLEPGEPLRIQGTAATPSEVADLQAALAASPLVSQVVLERADRAATLPQRVPQSNTGLAFTMTAHLWIQPPREAAPINTTRTVSARPQ